MSAAASSPGPKACQSRGAAPVHRGERLLWVDMLRGGALLGMIVYHAAWDLNAYGLVTVDPSADTGWRLFGRCVAGLFLLLSGFGLSLAQRRGATSRSIALRLGRIALAAALVSLVTRHAVPEAPVWFGILHCIVVTNALALLLLRVPTPLVLVAAVLAGLLPFGLSGIVGDSWAWTGLAAAEPRTLDFRPVLPWLSLVLIGLASGRTALAASRPLPAAVQRAAASRLLASTGRHSLAVYLIHQPLLFGLLFLTCGPMPMPEPGRAAAVLENPVEAGAFLRQCRAQCSETGGDAALCSSTCHCVLTRMLDPKARHDRDAAIAACRPAPEGAPAP